MPPWAIDDVPSLFVNLYEEVAQGCKRGSMRKQTVYHMVATVDPSFDNLIDAAESAGRLSHVQ